MSHASYRSSYIVFVHRDLLDVRDRPYQKLDPREQALYAHYARAKTPLGMHDPNHILETVNQGGLPLLAVGNYLQTSSQVMDDYYLLDQMGAAGLSFVDVHKALVSSQEPYAGSYLVRNVNAEANIITALICHADGKRPGSVCTRPAIRSILSHMR